MMWIYTENITHFFHIGSQWGFFFNTYCKLKHNIIHSAAAPFWTLRLSMARKDEWVVIKIVTENILQSKNDDWATTEIFALPQHQLITLRGQSSSVLTKNKNKQLCYVVLDYLITLGHLCNQSVHIVYRYHGHNVKYHNGKIIKDH